MEYKKNPEQWWQDEEIHSEYKVELKELKKKYKALFAKKHPKKKKKEK